MDSGYSNILRKQNHFRESQSYTCLETSFFFFFGLVHKVLLDLIALIGLSSVLHPLWSLKEYLVSHPPTDSHSHTPCYYRYSQGLYQL